MKKNTKVIVGGCVIFLTIIMLLIVATPGATGAEIELEEMINDPTKYDGKYVTTEGFLIEDSIRWDADQIELKFTIRDDYGNQISVYHHGVRPENFSEDVIVILQGFIKSDGTFHAERVQTKCPSKYEGEDESHYDIETHNNDV